MDKAIADVPLIAAAPETPAAATATLKSVLFGKRWRKTPAGARVIREMADVRVVGSAVARTPEGEVEGVLVRNMREKSYQLVGVDFMLAMPTAATDDFLTYLRRGHHGGGGRTQGPRTIDGKLYTVRRTVTLPMPVVADLSKRGAGVLSLGVRRLATHVRRRLVERHGAVADLRTLTDRVDAKTGAEGGIMPVRLYLDGQSMDTLHTLGGGNLSRGIRFAVWVAGKRLR